MQIEPGIYTDLSNEAYHGHHESYSKSSLSDLEPYPFNLIQKRKEDQGRKHHFDMGTAIHAAILEPDKFEDTIAVIPPEKLGKNGARSTNDYKAWAAAVPKEKAIVSGPERELVLRARDSVLEKPEHSEAREYVTGGISEVSVFWHEHFRGEETDEDTGYHRMVSDQYGDPATLDDAEQWHRLLMKCRPDHLPGHRIVTDLKTDSRGMDPEKFEKTAYDLKYHWSAALTLRGLTQATGKLHRDYFFVVVEIVPPFEVAVYRASQEFVALGKKEVMRAMEHLAWFDKNNIWPGMPNKVQQLGLPAWAFKKLTDTEGF